MSRLLLLLAALAACLGVLAPASSARIPKRPHITWPVDAISAEHDIEHGTTLPSGAHIINASCSGEAWRGVHPSDSADFNYLPRYGWFSCVMDATDGRLYQGTYHALTGAVYSPNVFLWTYSYWGPGPYDGYSFEVVNWRYYP